ncbi:MAG: RluA family pseudouridine synthase [Eubacteriaceae bacterium]|nr:RluA family pseudouridine synthase [Eubacteriaceae bacterium]
MPINEYPVSSQYDGTRLDRFCVNCGIGPRNLVQRLIRKGDIKVDGKKQDASMRLSAGNTVQAYSPHPPIQKQIPKLDLADVGEIIFEDENLFALSKLPGIPSQPAQNFPISASQAIASYVASQGGQSGSGPTFRAGVANRLDVNASGILLSAKNPVAARSLAQLFRENKIDKRYIALAHGKVEPRQMANYSDPAQTQSRIILYNSPNAIGPKASLYQSSVSVLEYKEPASLVEIQLVTGKKHQARVQMAHHGWPILGDARYSTQESSRVAKWMAIPRLFLHCHKMSFYLAAKRYDVFAPVPQDMDEALNRLGYSKFD